jgi:glycosyltransferase involved in cell wall biosynthesis
MPDVSVVISTFNRCGSLPHLLDQLLNSQEAVGIDYEVIIVDNNSTDDTRLIVQRRMAAEPRLNYVFEARQGVSYGRNAGIRVARAPVIAFTDDDNAPSVDWIANAKAVLDAHPEAAGAGGPVLPVWPMHVPAWIDRKHWSPLAILDFGKRPFWIDAQNPRCLLTANLVVRKTVLEAFGGFSPDYARCQDHELLVRLWRRGWKLLYSPELIVYATVPAERLTTRYHRWWHLRHGFYLAQMQFEESIDYEGHLLQAPRPAVRVLGTPRFVYKNMLYAVRQWIKSAFADRSVAREQAYHVLYLLAYIGHSAILQRPRVVTTAEQLAPSEPVLESVSGQGPDSAPQ